MKGFLFFNVLLGLSTCLVPTTIETNSTETTSSSNLIKTIDTYKISDITIDPFTITYNDMFQENGIRFKASKLKRGYDYTFFIRYSGENCPNRYLIREYSYLNFKTSFEVVLTLWDHDDLDGLIKFEMYYMKTKGNEEDFSVFGEFYFYFGDEMELKNSDKYILPLSSTHYPNEGRSEIYGEYVSISNVKDVYEEQYYKKFDFKNVDPIIETNSPITKGESYLKIEPKSGSYYSSKHKEEASYYFKDKTIPVTTNMVGEKISFDISKSYYVNENTWVTSESDSNSLLLTKELYFPRKYFDVFNEVNITLYFLNFGYNNLTLYKTFTVKFLEEYKTPIYEVVGEIDSIIDDENLKDINL